MSSRQIIVRIDRKALTLVAALILVAAFGRLLWSEVLTLMTTYPVPSGIYNQIVTTGDSGTAPTNTTLNRNAGNTILVPPTNAAGKVGIGTPNPSNKLEVAGDVGATSGRFTAGVQIGDDSSPCTGARAGALRWHGGAFEGCDGSAWKPLKEDAGPSPKCYDAGGAWSSTQNTCYFSSGACPAGWTMTNYTSTMRNTCTSTGGRNVRSSGVCTTGSHSRAIAAIESCSYQYQMNCNQRNTCNAVMTGGCSATLTERGCTFSQ
jgi:hypothetical protein